jgi:hypothetical protein
MRCSRIIRSHFAVSSFLVHQKSDCSHLKAISDGGEPVLLDCSAASGNDSVTSRGRGVREVPKLLRRLRAEGQLQRGGCFTSGLRRCMRCCGERRAAR